MVKVGGEDLYQVEEEFSPVAEEVDEGEWDDEEDESDLEEASGPECLWCGGEHEPEGDPEEWADRVADDVEEKRRQKMQALEKPEVGAKGSTRNVYDWRKKLYQLGSGISITRWKRRSRLAAREENLLSLKEREITFSHQ